MLYKTYLMTSVLALILFGVAQYRGISWSSEPEDTAHQTAHGGGHGLHSGGRSIFHK